MAPWGTKSKENGAKGSVKGACAVIGPFSTIKNKRIKNTWVKLIIIERIEAKYLLNGAWETKSKENGAKEWVKGACAVIGPFSTIKNKRIKNAWVKLIIIDGIGAKYLPNSAWGTKKQGEGCQKGG
jgi:hypothetical protein